MWLFGSSFFRRAAPPEVSPSQINRLIETWGSQTCQTEFLEELCYNGIPLCYRSTLWNLLAGNFLQITPELYAIFKERSVKLLPVKSSSDIPDQGTQHDTSPRDMNEEIDLEAGVNMHGKEESIAIICYDVPRTFAEIEDFHNNGPLAKNLEIILQTYACYRPDVGYVQGMSYLAAMLVYYLDEFNAFKCLANILGRRISFNFYQLKNDLIHQFTNTFDFFFQLHLPRLYNHFLSENVASEIFLLDWTMTLFSKTFSVEIAARLWDVFLLEGEIFVMKAAIGILKHHEDTLKAMEVTEIIRFLKRPPTGSTCPDTLLQYIRAISISKDAYEAIMLRNQRHQASCTDRILNQHQHHISHHQPNGKDNREEQDEEVDSNSFVHMLCPPFGVD